MILNKELIGRHNLCHYVLHFWLLVIDVNKDLKEFERKCSKIDSIIQ